MNVLIVHAHEDAKSFNKGKCSPRTLANFREG